MVHEADGATFLASDLPAGRVAVLFTADWCGPCRRFHPHFKRLHEGWVVDASDDEGPAWDRFVLRVVPTVIAFDDGVEARRWAGAMGAREMDEIEAFLGQAGH